MTTSWLAVRFIIYSSGLHYAVCTQRTLSLLYTVWQRAFASKTDKDLWWGCIGGAIFIFVTLTLVGVTGMVALWAPGVLPSDPAATDYAFFYLLGTLPNWVVGVCLVFSVALSCAAYDTMQTGE